MNRRQVGTEYERQAAAFLEERGCEVIERNYRCRLGEVDLIVRDGNYLVFVEVKYRQSERTGHPLEAVNPAKQRRISRTAVWYLALAWISPVVSMWWEFAAVRFSG